MRAFAFVLLAGLALAATRDGRRVAYGRIPREARNVEPVEVERALGSHGFFGGDAEDRETMDEMAPRGLAEMVVGRADTAPERARAAFARVDEAILEGLRSLTDAAKLLGIFSRGHEGKGTVGHEGKGTRARPEDQAAWHSARLRRFGLGDEDEDDAECGGVGVLLQNDETVDVCGTEDPPQCLATRLMCRGTVVRLRVEDGRYVDTSPLAPFADEMGDCQVLQVQCTGAEAARRFSPAFDGCFLRLVTCNGTEYAGQTYSGTLQGCRVTQLECTAGSVPRVLDFRLTEAAPSNGSCVREGEPALPPRAVCESGCAFTRVNRTCVCPLDRMGAHCERARPVRCAVNRTAPTPACRPAVHVAGSLADLVEGDEICFEYSVKDRATFEFSLACEFSDTDDMAASLAYDASFDYYARDGVRLAVSPSGAVVNGSFVPSDVPPVRMLLQPFDFNHLTDTSHLLVELMSPAQLLGDATVSFDLPFADFDDRFFAGDRLYFEVGPAMTDPDAPAALDIVYARVFIDFSDLDISRDVSTQLTSNTLSWIVGLTVGSAFALLCFIYWLRERINKMQERRRTRELEKLD